MKSVTRRLLALSTLLAAPALADPAEAPDAPAPEAPAAEAPVLEAPPAQPDAPPAAAAPAAPPPPAAPSAALPASPLPGACVTLDDANDTLSPDDRRGALALARAALVKAGEEVVEPPCVDAYVITNTRLGSTIYVTISGPEGQRDAKVTSIDELGDMYQQMILSLAKGAPLSEGLTRHNVTSRQQNRKRAIAESVWWFGLGPAYILGVTPGDMPLHIGGAWRYELDAVGIELGGGVTWTTNNDRDDRDTSVNGSFGIAGYWFASEEANNTAYFGAGLGYGGTIADTADGVYDGGGIQGTLSAGFEGLRASNIRAFVQFDAVLPMYTLTHDEDFSGGPTTSARDSIYAPLFLLKVGIGWAPRGGTRFRAF